MTVSEIFRPDGSATDMIDSMYDLLIRARVSFGIAELQDGRQLFVLPSARGTQVTIPDVQFELMAYLSRQGMSAQQLADELRQAVVDVI